MHDETTVLLFLFGPYLLFGTGLLIGGFWPNRAISKTTKFVSFFSYPFSFFAILLLSLSHIQGESGPNMFGFVYIILSPLFYYGSPLIVHAGWLVSRSTKKAVLSGAVEIEFDSIGVETSGELQKQVEEARDKVAHLRRFAERPFPTLNDINAHEVASRRLMALELKKKKSDS
ncbi:hypothetical protein [Roseibium album]|uniref:hypothetical protein n=1 Tax=Roseibium album TaxID=311410 RepID=UPI0024939364|nr:hypothetical protein [Roseibium album]